MAGIEAAIEKLEKSSAELQTLASEEQRAIRDAVREATKDATQKVSAEYKEKKAAARAQAREAEKAIKDAQARIQKALGAEASAGAPTRTRAPKGLRDEQFQEYVAKNPESKLSDIARGIGIQAAGANGVAQRLVKEGKVKKSDQKTYSVISATGATAKIDPNKTEAKIDPNKTEARIDSNKTQANIQNNRTDAKIVR